MNGYYAGLLVIYVKIKEAVNIIVLLEVKGNGNHHDHLYWRIYYVHWPFGTQEKSSLLSECCFVEWCFWERKMVISNLWGYSIGGWIFRYPIAFLHVNHLTASVRNFSILKLLPCCGLQQD